MTTFISKTQAMRLEMHEWLSIEKDDDLVEEAANFIAALRIEKARNKLQPMSVETYKERLAASRQDYLEGRYVTIGELKEEIKTW